MIRLLTDGVEEQRAQRRVAQDVPPPVEHVADSAFLPHARDLLKAEERAAASVRPGSRALRVDVIGRRFAPADLLRGFHRAHPGTALDVVTLVDADAATAAVRSGTIDASFRAVILPARRLPDGIESARALDEPLQLLTGPAHEFATARAVTPMRLAAQDLDARQRGRYRVGRLLRPGPAFGFTIEVTGPDFGTEPLLDTIADTGLPALPDLARRQPAPPAHHAPHLPRLHAARPARHRDMDTEGAVINTAP